MVTFLFSRERMACLPHAVREPDLPVGKAEVSCTASLAIPRAVQPRHTHFRVLAACI